MIKSRVSWDIGTAYDLFVSVQVLHEPEMVGLRGSWAAGVRSRLPVAERKTLEQYGHVFWVPLHWLRNLPGTKDGKMALAEMAKIPAEERLKRLALFPGTPPELATFLPRISEQKKWDESDRERYRGLIKTRARHLRPDRVENTLNAWANPKETGEAYYSAMWAYYEVFFAEEERRILPALQESLAEAKELAENMDTEALIAELSKGVHFSTQILKPKNQWVIVPSYWTTPLVIFEQIKEDEIILLYGGRSDRDSLVPGEFVPDTLIQALKALADPTRLRILRYLIDTPQTPSQLARQLRLRAPTVIHHLNELRLAGLVHLTVEVPDKKSERRYAARLEAVPRVVKTLETFLSIEDLETKELV